MNDRHHKGPGTASPPSNHNGDGTENPGESPRPVQAAAAPMTDLQEKARQIIAATPEVRPEKVGPLKQAIEQGAYEIDARKVANALITKLILDP